MPVADQCRMSELHLEDVGWFWPKRDGKEEDRRKDLIERLRKQGYMQRAAFTGAAEGVAEVHCCVC